MSAICRRRRLWLTLVSSLIAVFILSTSRAYSQGSSTTEDLILAERYAPVLYFHQAELFRPQTVDVMLETSRLRQARGLGLHANVLAQVSRPDLFEYRDYSYNLDAWFGDAGVSDYKNYTMHRTHYQSYLSPSVGGPPITVYAHVKRDPRVGITSIQYWLFYYYNDWFNKHEGDWEMVQVILDESEEPRWVVLSQHHGGTRRPWPETHKEDDTHPVVYVALGSHANYFRGDEAYPNGQTIGNVRLEIMDRTGVTSRTVPEVRLVPDSEEVEKYPEKWAGLEWLPFRGRWGEVAPQSDFSGPTGPAAKGDQWGRPYDWGMAQPLDLETWYGNRLRLSVTSGPGTSEISLRSNRGDLSSFVESSDRTVVLHRDLMPDESIVAEVASAPGQLGSIEVVLPEPSQDRVRRLRFENVVLTKLGRATLYLWSNRDPVLSIAGESVLREPNTSWVEEASWDAPDLIWAVGALPSHEVASGLALSLLAGLLPTLCYVALLYWSDRYEKEPASLLTAAFLWGAVPAVLIALATRIFFRLPFEMLGPNALAALEVGIVAPFVEEVLKGCMVLFIAIRHRREFDNVLDGIIYGAMVGFGFAMMSNVISYLTAFLQFGLSALANVFYVQGIINGLNQGLYTAIFGAGLGYARLTRTQWKRRVVALGSFVLAIGANGGHSLALEGATGWNLLTVFMTWAGLLTVMAAVLWSLNRQRRCLSAELDGEVPDGLRQTVIAPGRRLQAQWRAFSSGGFQMVIQARQLFQLCAELAFKKMQHRRFPGEAALGDEAAQLRNQLETLVDGVWTRLAN